ncbi:single-stranded-DNA-specific exonuclease RecJ [Aliidiomarina indica]|uniref:single-stranded-DNA-specific exonuclease RecJ n=1 Tax=Aliidiomarina indica TaxID=2749147 RepID=UPI00188F9EA7|nr:single-stranded-DNA-specific exonuclease RecJ [Aliidiomarina indica]
MTKIEVRRRTPSGAIRSNTDLPPLLRHIYACRGVNSVDELSLSATGLLHFNQLTDCEYAAERVAKAIAQQESICICGDFDADGATSVALLMQGLSAFGAAKLFYLVPNRFTDGYGLSASLVEAARREGAQLIITVDNGVSSHEGVERANSLGMDVIITDHHLPSDSLPNAYAVVNPNRRDCAFASKHLAGVGVAFYLLLALRAYYRKHDPQSSAAQVKVAQFLDYVAVGTVADVVSLDYNNRILVQQGLARIRQGLCAPGIRALLDVAGRAPGSLQARDLGFTVGPRINAAGRLEDIQMGIECLLSQDPQQAQMLALRLDELNRQRRTIEQDMQRDAERLLAQVQWTEQSLPAVVAMRNQDWHQGVIGILAGRLKERLHRPVMTFAPDDEGFLKGSCRSVPGIHIRDFLEQVSAHTPGCIRRFGGHAMAAGLTVPAAAWDDFYDAVQVVASRWIDKDALEQIIWSDGELTASDLNVETAESLQQAGPFGQGFPAPLFDGDFRVVQARWLKDAHLKLVVQPQGSNDVFDAIAFNAKRAPWQWQGQEQVHLTYQLDINEFRGQRTVQLMIQSVL